MAEQLKNRNVVPYLWEKTDMAFFMDWMREGVNGTLLFAVVTVLIFVWFIIDAAFDVWIISSLSGNKTEYFGRKFKQMIFAKLIFWVPYLLLVSGIAYAAFKFWVGIYACWPLLIMAAIGRFVLFFGIKCIDMVKIHVVVSEGDKLKVLLSKGTTLTFNSLKETAGLNTLYALFFAVVVFLTISINIHFIAHGVIVLWVLWAIRQVLVLARQFLRYCYTGYWLGTVMNEQ